MAKAFFIVRATVADASLWEQFNRWYAEDHLPAAIRIFRCEKAWRFWSETEPNVHQAVYQFADSAACKTVLASEGFKSVVADFNHAFPQGVTRTREIMTLVDEREGV